jgi:hypothetical protein
MRSSKRSNGPEDDPRWSPELAAKWRVEAERKNAHLLRRVRALMVTLQKWETALLSDVMGDAIGRYVQAIDSALAKQENTVLDQLLVADLVHSYGEMVANARADECRKDMWMPEGGIRWSAERAADTVIHELVELPARAARPFAFPFGKKLAASRTKLVTAIVASSRRGRRRRGDSGPTADAALIDLLGALGMAVKNVSVLRMSRKRLKASRSGVTE